MIPMLASPSEVNAALEGLEGVTCLALSNEFAIVLLVCLGLIIGILLIGRFLR